MQIDAIQLHSGAVMGLDLDPPKLDLTLHDVTFADGWITGIAQIDASAFGASLGQQDIPFKTKDNVAETFDLGVAALILKVRLADAHRVCGEASLSWGPFNPSTGEQCVPI